MRFQECSTYYRFVLLILLISLAGAQTRQPEVPYVPTTDEAVQAMLKLGDVKKGDMVYDLWEAVAGSGAVAVLTSQWADLFGSPKGSLFGLSGRFLAGFYRL